MFKQKFSSRWILLLFLFYAVVIPQQCSTSEKTDQAKQLRVGIDTNSALPGFTGRWKHVADFYSIGDASIHWRDVDSSGHYLQFNSDSTIESNIPFFTRFNHYSIAGESTLRFDSSSLKQSIHHYQLKNTGLEISLQCIEACGLRLVKKNNK